jgi:YrbI family 3-deoxy-D-manno-octulosonate 8-phosphate phosphatase
MNYKVLITTSGLGSRLGEATKYTNKSLIKLGEKPVLSYIIEAYPQDVELVITVGYFADHVKEFVSLAYPDRKITFVQVDLFEGPGSSLGYSMLQARNALQCPFIYHACDTIVEGRIPAPDKNWIGGYRGGNIASMYSSFDVLGDRVVEMKAKGALKSDYVHIGLVGVNDYLGFWGALEWQYHQDTNNASLNDCSAINLMLKRNDYFVVQEFATWFDTGNVESLNQARQNIKSEVTVLDKIDESIFIFDNFVIKFFADVEIVKQRVTRAGILTGLTPPIKGSTNNFYSYQYVPGDLYSRVVTPSEFSEFLRWAKDNLWIKNQEVEVEQFRAVCRDFYENKTLARVNKFINKNGIADSVDIINGVTVPTFAEMFKKIDFVSLVSAEQYRIHGDFILDNIIKTESGYSLLDWRQNFGGLLKAGDIYYDLAKLNHNLTVNHDIVNKDLFKIAIKDKKIECDILRKNSLVLCQQVLEDFLTDNGFNLNRVKLLTALIWLNMSPLHQHPLDSFLFYFGKLHLWQALQDKSKADIKEISNDHFIPKNLILDVDGVFTTGQFLYTADGKFAKTFGPHDNDGLKMIKKYINICAVSADRRGFDITRKRIAEDMGLTLHLVGEDDRLEWLKNNFDLSRSIYMGDSMIDAKIFPLVSYSIAPANAFFTAKKLANFITESNSGEGAVAEACLHVIEKFFEPGDLKNLETKLETK